MRCEDYYKNIMLCKGCYILGSTGPQGLEGPTGPAPKLSIGTITTGAPGSKASVTLTPTNETTYFYNKTSERK